MRQPVVVDNYRTLNMRRRFFFAVVAIVAVVAGLGVGYVDRSSKEDSGATVVGALPLLAERSMPASSPNDQRKPRNVLTVHSNEGLSAIRSIYQPSDFQLAVYGNPYKAVVDAKTLAPGIRNSIYVHVDLRCTRVLRLLMMAKGQYSGRKLDGVADAAAASQALISLESQCGPIWQDIEVANEIEQATGKMLRSRQAFQEAIERGGALSELPLEAWADILAAQQSVEGGRVDPRYFRGIPWGGLANREQYNRAVQQALISLTVSPDSSAPHLDSLFYCAEKGICGIPANRLAVHDLPADAQAKVLAVAQAMQLEIAAGNYRGFGLHARP